IPNSESLTHSFSPFLLRPADRSGDILADVNRTVRRDQPQNLEDLMADEQQAPAKKGLPTIAWIGIGCGALIVLMVVAFAVGSFFLVKKGKEFAADFEDNPGMAAARMVVKFNPELEEVSADEENGTITVRNTKTGEEITVNFDDIKEGRFSFSSDGREVTVNAGEVGESGTITVTDDKGTFVLSKGDILSEALPSWVPVYPESEPGNRRVMRTDDVVTGGFEVTTSASVDEVVEFYRSALEGDGFVVNVNTFSGDDGKGGMVNARDDAGGRTVMVIIGTEEGSTSANVSYSRESGS
ncbi:MAG: hypothetical protein ACC742_09320, partial [Thermoanaerobaculales bacterium]